MMPKYLFQRPASGATAPIQPHLEFGAVIDETSASVKPRAFQVLVHYPAYIHPGRLQDVLRTVFGISAEEAGWLVHFASASKQLGVGGPYTHEVGEVKILEAREMLTSSGGYAGSWTLKVA